MLLVACADGHKIVATRIIVKFGAWGFSAGKTDVIYRVVELDARAVRPYNAGHELFGGVIVLTDARDVRPFHFGYGLFGGGDCDAGSDGEAAEGLHELGVDGLVVFDCFEEGHVYDFIVFDADHHVALVFHKCIDGRRAHAGGKDAVVGSGGAAALEVSEDRYAHVVFGKFFFDAFGHCHGSAGDGAFGNEHYRGVFALAEAVFDEFAELVDFG